MKLKHFSPILILTLISVIFISGCTTGGEIIGGDTDEHGCLLMAGYSWNESIGACLREWELNENQREAARIAVAPLSFYVTVTRVDVARCPGCFAVHLQRNDNRQMIQVTLENWEIKSDVSAMQNNDCVTDYDCVVFGETGDCNCGCYNKDNLPSGTGGECFRSAPIDCKCVDGKCEGIFEGDMSYSEARQIAEQSECVEEGDLTEHARFSGTNNWEIDLEPFIEKEGCNPVCVVSPIERTAEINWRCDEINSFDDCVEAGYTILPPVPGGYTECRTPDGRIFYFEEINESLCARDGELLREPDEYCCEGLKEWPIPDTRLSIADVCYEVGQPSEILMGMCIKCGDGLCENHLMYDENPCNCPEDCAGKNKSMFQSIEDFCLSNDWNLSLSKMCEETIKDSPICELC